MKRLSLISLSAFAISTQIQFTNISDNAYLNQIVVSATKTKTTLKKIGHSIEVVTQKQIKDSGFHQLTDLLKTIPSLFVTSNGGPGSVSSLFLRGSNSEFTLFLVDGIKVHDNSSPARGASFQNISLDNVERIEILKGSQSSIWGSDAMAGVVNVITKSGQNLDSSEAFLEYGSFSSLRSRLSFSGGTELLNYYFNINRVNSDGFSSKSEKRANVENDPYKSLNIDLKLDFKGSSDQNTSVIIKRAESTKDYDGSNNEYGFQSDSTQTIFALSHDRIGGDGAYEEKYQFSSANLSRDMLSTGNDPDHYDSKEQNFSFLRTYFLDKHTISTGLEHSNSSAFFKTKWSKLDTNKTKIQSIFFNDLIDFNEEFKLQIGGRRDNISGYGSHSTYRISPSYLHNKTRLYSSYSTAFKAPSLYQKFNGLGNKDLKPSENKSFDFGIDYQLDAKTTLGFSKFKNDYSNLIDYVSFSFATNTATYKNIAEVETYGYEAYIKRILSKKSHFSYSYNRTTSRDAKTGITLLRRPIQKHNMSFSHQFDKKNRVHLTYTIVGSRTDAFFNNVTSKTQRLILESYKLLNLNFQREISKDFKVSLRLDNLLNEKYEEVYEYGTSKRAIYLGISKKF